MFCFLHLHRIVLQSATQLITRIRFSGAGARSVCSGTNPMSHCCHPTLSHEVHQQIPSLIGLAVTHEYCGALFIMMLVVALMDEHDTCSMRPSHRTADAERSPGRQSSYHCIVPSMLSLLHMSHRDWKLNA